MNRKGIILILLIMCVLSIPAIGAAEIDVDDTNNTKLTTTDSDVVNQGNDLSLSVSNNDTLLSDVGESFTQLNEDVSGDDVTLTKNYTYVSSDSAFAGGITLSGTKTINGNGNVVIDASNQARIFKVTAGSTVTFKGITFINANPTQGPGGAIFGTGVVHIENCKFINNTVNNANGGAVCLSGAGSTITNSYFEGNKATKNPNNMNSGGAGAVFLNASNIMISNSEFIKNMAGLNGGAIGSSAMRIASCTITNCTFTSNTANGSAGAIGMQSRDFHIRDSTFKHNEAKGMFTIYPGNGGAMVMRGWDSYAYNCTFIDNTAAQHGGAVYLTNTSYEPLNNNTGFVLCTFIDNNAGMNGGAVDWYAGATYGYINDSTFINNTAKRSGGAVHWSGHYGTISNSTFIDNNATGEITSEIGGVIGGGDGGAVVWVGSYGTIKDNCIFTNNYAANRGGAIFLHGNATENCTDITITHSHFNSNYAGMNGGAVDWNEGAHSGNILYSTFTNNTARSNGGAVFWSGHDGEIYYSNFTGNKAEGLVIDSHNNIGDGGAIIWSGLNGTVNNCRFVDNEAAKRGGAVYLQNCTHGNCTNTTFAHDYFKNNTAGTNGGAIDWHEGANDGNVLYSVFEENTAKRSGGAVFWNGNVGEILHSNFTGNKALGIVNATSVMGDVTYGGDGGAVIWTGSEGIVDDCRFVDNEAAKRGGAIFLQGTSKENCTNTTFKYSYFKGNVAGTNGGAIDWSEGANDGLVDNVTFINNTAKRSGGAIFWNGHDGTITYARFYGNRALGIANATDVYGNVTYGGDGGAVMWSGGLGKVYYSNFVNNTAAKRGGAVFLQGSATEPCDDTIFKDDYFANNVAGTNGGAIDWSEGANDGLVDSVTFINNTARRSGGAIYWYGERGRIIDSNFDDNRALGLVNASSSYGYNTTGGDGGAVIWTGSNGIVDNCNFTDNYAAVRGGAVFLQGSLEGYCMNVTFSNSFFENNVAETNGGAVNFYVGALEGRILNSTFKNNNAKTGIGGAVVWKGYNGTIQDSSFTENYAKNDGGSVYFEGDYGRVYNTSYDGNTAGDDGGALCWAGNYGKIYNLTANNNRGISEGTSHSKGGTLIVTGSNMTIDVMEISNSYAEVEGGGLFLTGNNVNISNVEFYLCSVNDDSAENVGGALDIVGNNTRLINATIQGSNARYGGAIYVLGNHTRIISSSFDNSSANLGGSIYISGDNATIIGSNFTNSYAYKDGGAIYITGFLTEIYNSTFINGTAADDGGAVYWQGNNGTLDGCVFVNNKGISSYEVGSTTKKHTSKGGTISIIGNYTKISNSNFTDSFTENNNGENFGGTIFITGHDVDLVGCNFNNSEARSSDGGTIYIIGHDVRVINSTIDNSSARKGGAIYIDGVNASVINSTLNNTFAKTGNSYTANNLGGAVYIKGNNANIIGSEIENASAYQGGGLYLEGDYCNVTNSSVKEGYAYVDGGALYSTGSYSNVYFSNFTSNEARGDGGAMYWHGGKNSRNNTIVGCIFLENVAYANSGSNTKGGGAIYWSEGGYYGTIKDSQFINNSVQSTVKADGGAILWDKCHFAVIDNCIFDGDYIETTNTGDVWIQGGAIYLRVDDPYTISNSKFINCYSEKEAGALYVQSNTNGRKILIVNTTFINNVAQSIGQNSNGGGAIQVKQADIVILQNVTFINNTANQGGAVTVYDTKTNITFIDCTFDNNTANNGNGGSIWAEKKFFIYNTTIANSTASGYGGGLYTTADLSYDNLTFINNTATSGGGLYWNKAGIKIQNMEFINNTALERGGGIYVTAGTATIQNVNMTGNKAFTGSAIWADKDITLVDVYLMENQANSSSLDISFDESTGKIVVLFKGKDKYLNAIYLNGGTKLYCTNVTYWDKSGETNSGASKITWPTTTAQDTPEGGQNLTVRVYGGDGKLVEQNILTNNDGKVYLNLADIISDTNYHEMYVESELNDDTYYTIIKATTRSASQVNASANKTTYHSNSTLNVNVTQGATGNVSVYIGDTFIANITLDNSKGSINMSTLVEGVYLPVGNHTLSFVYNGNVKYDKSNTTAILEITKITPVMLLNVTGIGYNLLVNVTVMDGEYNITDATGNVTIQVEDRTATIYLGNGQGMTIIYGLPIGNYTVNATYHGDNNYYNITNSTEANVTEKTQTVLVLDVDSEKLYYINETVPIKVTILPKGEGNITLYINGIPHELTLQTVDNSTFVEFNATELKDGINYVFATYEGTEIYAPSWAQDRFNVTKYNSTIGIETANITFKDTEIINITLPEDAEGIIKVLINDTPYLVELVGGSAQVNVSDLAVGTYNVTVIFNGDKKYYNSTNSTLFNVTKIKPAIEIDVDNVTYGNETVITVILPDGVTGNVTIKVNDTILVYEEQEIVDGKVTLPGTILPAGNYTVEATYNGDGNYSVCTAQTNFTVYRQAPVLTVTVEDINYGESANITVTVPDGVTGTIIIKVNGTESEPLTITEGKVNLTVAGLAVGNYPVEVIYSGNDNYSDDTVTTDFEVFQIGTELDVDVHDITVWDTEYINITIKDAAGEIITNATGNVTINIDGVNHTAEIKDGIARFNTSDLTVGHKVIWVFYDGDRNLTANRSMAEFDVGQRAPMVNVTAQNITVGEDGNITVKVPANATGYVIIEIIGGDTYFKNVTNGQAVVYPQNLKVGNYTVRATYYGISTDNYTVNTAEANFTVKPIEDYNITVIANNITYGENATVIVTLPSDATGNVTIYIGGVNRGTVNITNGIATLTDIAGLKAGQHEVNVTYNGNERYASKDKNGTIFHVLPTDDWTLDIDVEAHKYGEDTIITVTLPENAKENVTLEIDGVNYTVKLTDGVGELRLNNLSAGLHEVNAYYPGDENYTNKSSSDKFIIDQATPTIIINATPAKVGDNATINITVSGNATGNVTIYVDGQMFERTIVNHTVSLNVTGLASGNHNVVVFYKGDQNYTSNINSTSLLIVKNSSDLVIVATPESVVVGKNTTITVTSVNVTSGNVIIEVNGINYTVALNNGVAKLNVTLPVGDYTAKAYFLGDDKYNASTNTSNVFHVINKTAAWVNITADKVVEIDNNLTFTVTTNSNSTLVVKVNGVVVTPVDGVYRFNGTVAGNYTITAEVAENDYYTQASNSTVFTVIKHNSTVSIDEIPNHFVGDEFDITINNNTAVVVTINGKEYPVVDGKVVVNTTKLPAGEYTVTATVYENDKYYGNSSTVSFNITKRASSVNITVNPEYYVGEAFNITIQNNTAVNVTINGKEYSIVNGNISIPADELPAGHYVITATIKESDKYLANSTTKEFDVIKNNSNVNVTADPIKVGQTAIIEIAGPNDYDGMAVVTVYGKDYMVKLTSGAGQLEIAGLGNGTYDINVTYLENDKYLQSINDTVKLIVSKVDDAEITSSVENITVGDPAVIKVTLPEDATGNVTVTIGNITRTVPITGGENEILVPGVPVGDHEVKVTYNGDNKYLPANTTTSLTVKPAETDPSDIKVVDEGNGTVVVVVPKDATGNVTITINGTNYPSPVINGTATFDLTDENPGTYNVTATYSGDKNYTPATTNANVTIPKHATPMSIEVKDAKVGETVKVTVNVPEDLKGNVTVEINGKTYSAKPSNGKAEFEITGLLSGNKTVIAEYDGDDWYMANSTTVNFTVSKNPAPISVEVDNSTNGQATITVTLPEDAKGYVIVNVDGVDYGINLTAGDKSVTVPITHTGDYVAKVNYLGDDKYLGNSTSKDFHASSSKAHPNIAAEVENVPVGEDVTVKVTVPEGADGNVTVTIDNVTVTAPVKSGENIIKVPGVSEGNHDVNISYSGNDRYEPEKITKSVSVFRSIIANDMTRGWGSPYDYKAEFLDETGHVIADTEVKFVVNGKTYTAKTNNQGIAYLDTSKLPVGKYNITCINLVTGEQVTAKTTIVKRLIENKDITMDFLDGTWYKVRAIGDDGKPVGEGEFVQISVHTVSYSCKTDKNGYAKLKINLNPGKYTITAEYKNTTVKNKLVVKQTFKLVKKTVSVKKGKKLVLQAKLKWSNGKAIKGKVIKIKFKGKTYKAKTNSKGIAKVTIKTKITKKLKKGKKYAYSATYQYNTVKGKVYVK